VAIAEATRYARRECDIALRLHLLLKPRLAAERRTTVYETLERPLIPVLAEMERAGIAIARSFLAKLRMISRATWQGWKRNAASSPEKF